METNLNNVSERVVLAQPLLQGMQQITESALTNNQQINQHHSYWISLMWNGKYNISLFYINNVKTFVYVNKKKEWKSVEIKSNEKKGIEEFVMIRKDGEIVYNNNSQIKILKFEEVYNKNMIEYDSNGNKVYEGECEGDMSKGFHRSGYGKEFFNNKLIFEGYWNEDIRHGEGKSYVDGKVYYEGEWDGYYPNGKGKIWSDNNEVKYEGFWTRGYLQVDEKYFCYYSGRLEVMPGMKWIWSEVYIGLLFLILPNILSLHTFGMYQWNYYFLVFGLFYLVIAFLQQFQLNYYIFLTYGLILVYTVIFVNYFIMISYDFSTAYSHYPTRMIFYSLVTILIPYLYISYGFTTHYKINYPFPFKSNMFSYIQKKNRGWLIYIEILIGLYCIMMPTIYLLDNDWEYDDITIYDLRFSGLQIHVAGILYLLLTYLQSHNDLMFKIGTFGGILCGVFFWILNVASGMMLYDMKEKFSRVHYIISFLSLIFSAFSIVISISNKTPKKTIESKV